MGGCVVLGETRRELDDLRAAGARAASGFRDLGVGREDRIATLARNSFESFEAAFAAAALGAYVVPVNWHSAAPELDYILADSGAKVLVAQADLLEKMGDGISFDIPVFSASDDGREPLVGGRRIPDWKTWYESREPIDTPPPPPAGTMIYTSGTTGKPKGVRRMVPKPENLPAISRIVNLVFGLDLPGRMRTVMTGPMYHSAPHNWAMTSARVDAHIVLQERFDAAELLRLVEEHRITHLQMVPTMFWRLLKLPEEVRNRHDLSSLKFVVHAAAPCPPEVKRQMLDWWGPVIYEYYGASETGPITFSTPDDALKKPGSIGRLVEGAVLKVVDADGAELPTGEVGEFYMRQTLWPPFEYHGRPEATRDVEKDGLVTVGDMGYVDEDGYVFMLDRAKDMVISGGANIYPAEIEAVLLGHPEIQDCAVIGVPDEEYGELVMAVVQGAESGSLSDPALRAWLDGRMAKNKIPRRFVFRSELPREDSGKIFKNRLRDEFWKGAERRI